MRHRADGPAYGVRTAPAPEPPDPLRDIRPKLPKLLYYSTYALPLRRVFRNSQPIVGAKKPCPVQSRVDRRYGQLQNLGCLLCREALHVTQGEDGLYFSSSFPTSTSITPLASCANTESLARSDQSSISTARWPPSLKAGITSSSDTLRSALLLRLRTRAALTATRYNRQ
jgi:hypothetical protein